MLGLVTVFKTGDVLAYFAIRASWVRSEGPGELRWYTAGSDGEDIEVDGRGPQGLTAFGKPVAT